DYYCAAWDYSLGGLLF
nr:immunoglobulin light chain junction region [Macaca mulatta]